MLIRTIRRWIRSYGWIRHAPIDGVGVLLKDFGIGPRLLGFFPSLKTWQARAWFVPRRPVSFPFRLLQPSIYQVAFLDQSDEKRYAFLRQVLEAGGVAWAEHYDVPVETRIAQRYGILSGEEHYPLYRYLATFEVKAPALFLQVGCSSGAECEWLARQRPNDLVVGTDITLGIVERARDKHRAGNLRYLVADAASLAKTIEDLLTFYFRIRAACVVFNSGSLQYAVPSHLKQFAIGLATLPVPVTVVVQDNGYTASHHPFELAESQHRGKFSWTHNYPAVLRSAGFEIETAQVIRAFPPRHPRYDTVILFIVAHTRRF